jgi:hypothetical protein
VSVVQGGSQTFTISSNAGYEIDNVLVNESNQGPIDSYTFNNVQSDQTISASFKETTVDPCLVTTLPYLQDFNAAAAIPSCWSTSAPTGSVLWSVGTTRGGLSGTTGNYAYVTLKGKSALKSELISVPFDLTGYSSVSVSFDHYYLHNNSTASVYYSTNNGLSWTQFADFSASTSNPAAFSNSISFTGEYSHVLFKWELDYPGGSAANSSRSWFVDNITISGTSQTQASLKSGQMINFDTNQSSGLFQISCFPNPTSGKLYIGTNMDLENAVLTITDIRGREAVRTVLSTLSSGNRAEIDMSALKSGLYLISVTGKDSMATQRVVLQQ